MGLKILFVDDEIMVLEGMQRMLRSMRKNWQTAFAASGPEALAILDRESFDVVVSDMRMPGMDGAELLGQVKSQHPEIVRIILSGHSDKDMVMKAVLPAHQFLSKPCDADILTATINRTCALRDLLTDPALRLVVARLESLPSLQGLYLELMHELQSETSSIARIGRIISQDIGMTAKVLQLVNSAFFGHIRHVSSPAQAAELLGLENLKTLVLSTKIFSQFDDAVLPNLSVIALWNHSLATGGLARAIAMEEGQAQAGVDDAFMAGILHDAGKLILAASFPAKYGEIIEAAAQGRSPLWQEENRVFGVTHAKVGAYLFSLWGLPCRLVEAVAFHHDPGSALQTEFSPLTAVYVGNCLERQDRAAAPHQEAEPLDLAYLESIGMRARLHRWQECCRQALREKDNND
jgi:HD-like signal output (HDOD) protein